MRERLRFHINDSDRIQVHSELDGIEILISTEQGEVTLTRNRAAALSHCIEEVLNAYSIAEPETVTIEQPTHEAGGGLGSLVWMREAIG